MLVRGRTLRVVLAVASAVCGAMCAAGQQVGTSVAATSVAGVMRSLASRSGVVFVGQVQSIVPSGSSSGGVVEITFQVQKALLGSVGATYVLREWAGRWTGGRLRYRVGQRGMFFLHAPSAAGLSSPVDGMTGVVPLVVGGADAAAMLDVRWLATRVVRAVGSPLAGAETGAMTVADAEAVVSGWQKTMTREPVLYPLPGGIYLRAPVPAQPAGPVPTQPAGPVPTQPAGPVPARAGGPVPAQPTETRRVEMMSVPGMLDSQEAVDVQR